jgi:flagellar biosynthesis anti-sigma factor FlgM
MKITETKDVATLRDSTPVEKKSSTREDRITAQQTEAALREIAIARQSAGGSRAARLNALRTAIENGTYKPDPTRIAQEILEDAELIARLQAMIAR